MSERAPASCSVEYDDVSLEEGDPPLPGVRLTCAISSLDQEVYGDGPQDIDRALALLNQQCACGRLHYAEEA